MNTHFQKNQHAESFLGNAREPLEEERKKILENIVLVESMVGKMKPEEYEKLVIRLWEQKREIEVKLKNIYVEQSLGE